MSIRAALWIAFLAPLVLVGCHKSSSGPVAPLGSPKAPTDLVVTVGTANSLALKWTDNSDDETGFEISRLAHGQPWNTVVTLAADITEYVDPDLAWQSVYYYRVRATNLAGASLFSNTAWAETRAAPSPGYRRACAIVVGHDSGAVAESARRSREHLWMWSKCTGREKVVADAPLPAPLEVAVLDGGLAGAAWIEIDRQERSAVTVYDMSIRFAPLTADEDGDNFEFCFMLHDMARGDYVTAGLHSASRLRTQAQLPVVGAFGIEPRRPYQVSVVVDRERQTFDLAFAGMWLARDVPLDGAVVGPVRYVHR